VLYTRGSTKIYLILLKCGIQRWTVSYRSFKQLGKEAADMTAASDRVLYRDMEKHCFILSDRLLCSIILRELKI